jgi:hypothetical protein
MHGRKNIHISCAVKFFLPTLPILFWCYPARQSLLHIADLTFLFLAGNDDVLISVLHAGYAQDIRKTEGRKECLLHGG